MSVSNSIKTIQLEPLYFSQERVEFRLPTGRNFLSNLRMVDVGVSVSNNMSVYYPTNVGAYQLIKNIFLYNDNIEIASLHNCGPYVAFKNIVRGNANAYDVAQPLVKSGFGFNIGADGEIEYKWPKTVTAGYNSGLNTSAWLDMRILLPFLQPTSYLLGEQMENLRLVIEWENNDLQWNTPDASTDITGLTVADPCVITMGDVSQFAVGQSVVLSAFGSDTDPDLATLLNGKSVLVNAVDSTAKTITIGLDTSGVTGTYKADTGSVKLDDSKISTTVNKPTLLIDEILGDSKLKNSLITYVNLERERVYIPVMAGTTQQVEQRLRAFDGKQVNRLLVINEVENYPNYGVKNFASKALHNERLNYMVNGKKYLNFSGITTNAMKTAMLNDTYGSVNTPQGSAAFMNIFNGDGIYGSDGVNRGIVGTMAYGALPLRQKVEEIVIQYNRDAYPTSAQDAANGNDTMNTFSKTPFNMTFYAEIIKTMTVSNGAVKVSG